MTENEKYEVIARFQTAMSAQEIATELDLSYGGVLKLRREYNEAVTNNTVSSLVDTERVLLTKVGEELGLPEAAESLTAGIAGLDHLSDSLQRTAMALNIRVNSLMLSVTTLSELEHAAEILCKLQTAFVNKNLTQVNVQNNFAGDTPKYTQFLGDKPPSC